MADLLPTARGAEQVIVRVQQGPTDDLHDLFGTPLFTMEKAVEMLALTNHCF
jgi:hypothetical protein